MKTGLSQSDPSRSARAQRLTLEMLEQLPRVTRVVVKSAGMLENLVRAKPAEQEVQAQADQTRGTLDAKILVTARDIDLVTALGRRVYGMEVIAIEAELMRWVADRRIYPATSHDVDWLLSQHNIGRLKILSVPLSPVSRRLGAAPVSALE